jgi:hypothetical protein
MSKTTMSVPRFWVGCRPATLVVLPRLAQASQIKEI